MGTTGMIVNCASLCASFPRAGSPEVSRDAILNSIEDFFNSDFSLVWLDGKPDSGKTQILRQFALRHANRSISIFVRPDSWYLQDAGLLYKDIAAQAGFALRQNEEGVDEADEVALRSLFVSLQRAANKERRVVYFVLDGIDGALTIAPQTISRVLRILPFELSQFRFLISGPPDWVPATSVAMASRKPISITGFTLMETGAFLGGLGLSGQVVEQLHTNCGRGNPGFLASARRSLEFGMS